MKKFHANIQGNGSIELIAFGLLIALLIVLALPVFSDLFGAEGGSGIKEYSLPR